jgi:hypothetical protein
MIQTDVLLDGEDPATTNLDDIQHWVRVYTELVVGALGLDRQLDGNGSDAIRERSDRWGRRLSFWRTRSDEIGSR